MGIREEEVLHRSVSADHDVVVRRLTAIDARGNLLIIEYEPETAGCESAFA